MKFNQKKNSKQQRTFFFIIIIKFNETEKKNHFERTNGEKNLGLLFSMKWKSNQIATTTAKASKSLKQDLRSNKYQLINSVCAL